MNYRVKIIGFILGLALPAFSHAAIITTQPSQSTMKVGQNFSARIVIDSQGKIINNAEAVLSYPFEYLEITSVSTTGSIFTIWAENPTYSNANGRLSFNGGIPNPGYSGGAGLAVTVVFHTKKAGTAPITISSAAIRENDGLGTNILSGQSGATVNITAEPTPSPITPAPAQAPNPVQVPIPIPVQPPATSPITDPHPTPAAPTTILILNLSRVIKEGERIKFEGVINKPEQSVQVYLQPENGMPRSYSIQPDNSGKFIFESELIGGNGNYSVWVQTNNTDGQEVLSDISMVQVQSSLSSKIKNGFQYLLDLFTIPNLIILLLGLASAIGWYKYLRLRSQFKKIALNQAQKTQTVKKPNTPPFTLSK